MRVEPYRWRLSGSFAAHLFKATAQQHHRALAPAIARLVPAAGVVFDVGAHAGQYAKLFARAAANGRVYAFEPGSYARAILRTALWLNRLGNVTVVPLALGAECGVDVLNVPVKGRISYGFGLSHLGRPQTRWPAIAQELAAIATIDAVVGALGLDRLDFIKADIEGWEMAMLRGGEESLRRFQPTLLIELAGAHLAHAGDRIGDAFAFLAGLGYAAFELSAAGGLVAAAEPHDGDFWFISSERAAPAIG